MLGIRLSLFTLDGLAHLVLPAINLALYKISLVIRLTRAGVPVELHVYPGAFHAFQFAADAEVSKTAWADSQRALRRAM